MAIGLVDVAIGFAIGIVATTVAFELGIKKFLPKVQESDWTTRWSLNDLGPNPLIVAERITGVDVPQGARLVVKSGERSLDGQPDGVQVKVDPSATGNYAIGRGRALIFNSVIHPQAAAVETVEEPIVDKLSREFDRLWYGGETEADAARSGEQVPAASSDGAAAVPDDEVSAQGVVVGVEETDGGWLAKVSSQGKLLPVVVANGQDLEGQAVRVTGKVVYHGGQRVLKASNVERHGTPQQ